MDRDDSAPLRLSDEQRAVVEARDRMLLVLGGAGTGKTTTALHSASHTLREAATHRRVLFLTFSRTAVAQIVERAEVTAPNVDARIEVATFHGFAYRLVRAFGGYVGVRPQALDLQSKAEERLFGLTADRLRYDDLLPLALQIVEVPTVVRMLRVRWSLVICDEFQDTDDQQWKLLTKLGRDVRLLLLADPKQMIYDGFLGNRGVGPQRLDQARALGRTVELPNRSFRDPTMLLPACADAILRRQFDHPAILAAVAANRLRVQAYVDSEEGSVSAVRLALAAATQEGCRTVGVFAHGNDRVAELSAGLHAANIDHVLLGIPEAQGEAIAAMATLTSYALGATPISAARNQLGTFLTACVRREPPQLAFGLSGLAPLPRAFSQRLEQVEADLRDRASPSEILEAVANFWSRLNVVIGIPSWRRAAATFVPLARQVLSGARRNSSEIAAQIQALAADVRLDSMMLEDSGHLPPIRLMNLHQTKGREADSTVVLFRSDDYYGKAREPFAGESRLLYVALTRARGTTTILLPPNPHELVAPLSRWCDLASQEPASIQ